MPTPEEIRRRFVGMVLRERYRLDDLIGYGGMGAVFRATDQQLGRQVAVKVIWNDDVPPSWRARFVREARLPSHIRDANVVVVHDLSLHVDPDSGRELDFIVMELLDGEDVAAWLRRRGSIDLAQAIEILLQAARGVAAVHRGGIVHRDVKPRNLVAVPVDTGGVLVKVVDFGIAKSLATVDEFGDITVGPGFMGSAPYASPEQLHGRSELGPASDVFSLGVVAYELLTGVLPFSEQDRARLSQNLPVPVVRPSRWNPTIPSQVEAVVLRCLEADPADRYADARALVDALTIALVAAGPLAAPVADEGTFQPPEWTEPDLTVLHGGGSSDRAAPGGQDGIGAASGRNGAGGENGNGGSGGNDDSGQKSVDRRVNQTDPRPARWRPGRRTWAAAAGLAAVAALAGLSQTEGGASMFGALADRFNRPGMIRPGRPLVGELEGGDSVAAGKRYDVYRYRGEVGKSFTFSLDSAAFDGELEWGRVADGA
ncbi:MAG TPA: serine/threonine-protein kinase, partial [Longimicrobium sp.]